MPTGPVHRRRAAQAAEFVAGRRGRVAGWSLPGGVRSELFEQFSQTTGLEVAHDPTRWRLTPLPLHPEGEQFGGISGGSIVHAVQTTDPVTRPRQH